MDNVTHTLAGLVVARAALFLRGRTSRSGRSSPAAPPLTTATLTLSALANNAPDLDFLYRGITPGKLGYLLHHRGHTHTLLATLPLALVCLGLVAALLRLRGQRLPRSDWGFLFGVALFGGLLHVGMDFSNNYGVHPFWPIDDHWYYGDAVFIIEPWLMIALGGIAFGASQGRAARTWIGLILVGLCGVAWLVALGPSPLLEPALAALLSGITAAWLGWLGWCSPGWRRRSGLAVLALWLATQLLGRSLARASVRRALAADGAFELVSLVSTPLPANPLCWSVLALGVSGTSSHEPAPPEPAEQYVARQALVSAWPAALAPSSCPRLASDSTAPLVPLDAALVAASARAAPGVLWGREFRAPLEQLGRLAREQCVARAFLRFARAPFWLESEAAVTLIGDLRFDRSPAIEFAELPLDGRAACPPFEPPWLPPLRLLDPWFR